MQSDPEFDFNDNSQDLCIPFDNFFIQHVNPFNIDIYNENELNYQDLLDIINNKSKKKNKRKDNILEIIKINNKKKQKEKHKRINQNKKLGQAVVIKDNENNSNTAYATQEYKYLMFSRKIKDYTSNFLILPFFKNSKTRKKDNDDIYKKIRGKFFHEIIKKKLNPKLGNLKIISKFVFTKISQNTKIEDNIIYLNATLEEVLKSVKPNKKVFEELEKIGGGDEELKTILSTKIEYLYKEYFNSQEFQNSVKELIDNGEYYDYIYLYIKKSKEFFDYYSIKKLKNKEIFKSEYKDN